MVRRAAGVCRVCAKTQNAPASVEADVWVLRLGPSALLRLRGGEAPPPLRAPLPETAAGPDSVLLSPAADFGTDAGPDAAAGGGDGGDGELVPAELHCIRQIKVGLVLRGCGAAALHVHVCFGFQGCHRVTGFGVCPI